MVMRANEPKKLQTNLCQPQLHHLTQASVKVTCRPVCNNDDDKNHSLTTGTPVMATAQWENRALLS